MTTGTQSSSDELGGEAPWILRRPSLSCFLLSLLASLAATGRDCEGPDPVLHSSAGDFASDTSGKAKSTLNSPLDSVLTADRELLPWKANTRHLASIHGKLSYLHSIQAYTSGRQYGKEKKNEEESPGHGFCVWNKNAKMQIKNLAIYGMKWNKWIVPPF